MRLDKLTSKYSLVFWGKRFTALALLSGKEAAFMVQMLGLVVMDMRASTFGKNTIYPCSFSPTSQTLKQVVMSFCCFTFKKVVCSSCSFALVTGVRQKLFVRALTTKGPHATKPKQGRCADEAYRVGLKM